MNEYMATVAVIRWNKEREWLRPDYAIIMQLTGSWSQNNMF